MKTFERESDMSAAASQWMRDEGFAVKSEFVSPWGICDFVGVDLEPAKVKYRLELGQRRPVSSITRAAILLTIPDVKHHRRTSLEHLITKFSPSIPADVVVSEVERLVHGRFVRRSPRGALQKRNGWMPLHRSLVAVELKMSRIDEAMRQARNNLGFADRSYTAFPAAVAKRIAARRERWARYFDGGVGLLSVSPHRCEVLIDSRNSGASLDPALQMYCVEKFWLDHLRDSST